MHDTLGICQTQPDLRPRDRGKLCGRCTISRTSATCSPSRTTRSVTRQGLHRAENVGRGRKGQVCAGARCTFICSRIPAKSSISWAMSWTALWNGTRPGTLDGALAERPFHQFFHSLCRTYRDNPALHCDYAPDSFSWRTAAPTHPRSSAWCAGARRDTASRCAISPATRRSMTGPLGDAPHCCCTPDLVEFGGDTEEGGMNTELPLLLPPYSGMLLRIE